MSLFRSSNAGAEDLPTSTRRWQGFRLTVMVVFVVSGFYAQRYNTEPSGLLSLFAITLSAAVVFAVTLPLFLIQCRSPGIGIRVWQTVFAEDSIAHVAPTGATTPHS